MIADGLTWCRILSTVPITILVLAEMRWWVFGVYIAASLTDAFDGVFARRTSPVGYGAKFDGNADVFFAIMTLIWIAMLMPDFLGHYGLPYLALFLLLQTFLTALRLFYADLVVPHLPLGRIAMTVFYFLLPVVLVCGDLQWFVAPVLVLSILAKAQLAWHVWVGRSRNGAPDHPS